MKAMQTRVVEITVEGAIKKGHRVVTWPVSIIMFGTWGVCFYVGVETAIYWIIPVGFLLGPLFGWLYWSFSVPKWKLWSLRNVRNVHEWKERAIKEKLIWTDGSPFAKTEIWNSYDREILKILNNKFNTLDEPSVFKDDTEVPAETLIYWSKTRHLIEMAVMLIGVGLGFWLTFGVGNAIGLVFMIVSGHYAYRDFKKANSRDVQLSISELGIVTQNGESFEWNQIKNEQLEIKSGFTLRSIRCYIKFHFDDPDLAEYDLNYKTIAVDDFDISYSELEHLLKIYRGRFKQRNKE